MLTTTLDISTTGYFPKIISDYLNGKPVLKPFYKYPPEAGGFRDAVQNRKKIPVDRKTLVEVIRDQYLQSDIGTERFDSVNRNIISLENPDTFTVTTGHQLCLFTGPLYFIYKILSAVKLAGELNRMYQGKNGCHFVPVYWMVSEDHDFREINHIHLFGKKIEWQADHGCTGKVEGSKPAGKISTEGITKVLEELKNILGPSSETDKLMNLFRSAYCDHRSIADATRWLVNELFAEYGLVIIDGNDSRLKRKFTAVMEKDIFENIPHKIIDSTSTRLKESGYDTQINAREINCFFLSVDFRERIVRGDPDTFRILNTGLTFSDSELRKELAVHPERFSPNVGLRPLYQETILPNVAYVGGSNEIAYWMQLPDIFDHFKVNFPVLIVRNSVLWIDKTNLERMKKLGIPEENIFLPEDALIKNYLLGEPDGVVSVKEESDNISAIFETLSEKAGVIDKTFSSFVEAEKQKTLKGLHAIEEKMLRAGKKKNETSVQQIINIKLKLFPPDGRQLQERHENFIPWYLKYGQEYFRILTERFNPLGGKIAIFREDYPPVPEK
ncbi:MAG: bacillithiol biosynthesis cysteine-adding enzyme BshC [Bacteroidetes bacterium]|nr:bacillithiol biosynthesis cysteine-adding enzyme BshC [Bacteroidota bacterium]